MVAPKFVACAPHLALKQVLLALSPETRKRLAARLDRKSREKDAHKSHVLEEHGKSGHRATARAPIPYAAGVVADSLRKNPLDGRSETYRRQVRQKTALIAAANKRGWDHLIRCLSS